MPGSLLTLSPTGSRLGDCSTLADLHSDCNKRICPAKPVVSVYWALELGGVFKIPASSSCPVPVKELDTWALVFG